MAEIKRLTGKDGKVFLATKSAVITGNGTTKLTKGEFYVKLTSDKIKEYIPKERCIFIDDTFNINDVSIELIHTSHDAPYSVGYIIEYNDRNLVYVTDTGYINRKFLKKMVNKNLYLIALSRLRATHPNSYYHQRGRQANSASHLQQL